METRPEYVVGTAPKPTWKVPLIDLRAQYLSIKDEIDAAIGRVLDRGDYVMGHEVEAFESEWANFCRGWHCIAVSSGTDALYLALKHFQSQGWGEVITTPATFFATTQAALAAGLEVHFRDIDPDSWCLSIPQDNDLDLARLRDNRCIWLSVQLYGYPASLPTNFQTPTVEDAAQAHGQQLKGTVACYSFYPTKNLGAFGQAGAVVTNDKDLANAVRELRTYGERDRFVHHALTGNHRMDEMQAAILRVKLPHLAAWNRARKAVAQRYLERLKYLPGIICPADHPEHTWHIFSIRVRPPYIRSELAKALDLQGIQTSVRYPRPLHLQPALSFLMHRPGDFPEAEAWAKENLSLPIYPEMDIGQVEYVADAVRNWALRTT